MMRNKDSVLCSCSGCSVVSAKFLAGLGPNKDSQRRYYMNLERALAAAATAVLLQFIM